MFLTILPPINNRRLLRFADYLTRQSVIRSYDFFEASQWWTRKQLEEYQNLHLRKLVSIAEQEVPFYHELFKKNNVSLDAINSIADLPKLPVVTKKILKQHYPSQCTRKTGLPEREHYTSGSSGNPFRVMIDNLSMSQSRALMILRANYSGWKIGEPVFQTGMSVKRGFIKRIKHLFFRTYYASAYDLSDKKIDYYLEKIEKNKIKFLMGYPGSIFALAVRAKQIGFTRKMLGIVTWGDNLYEHFRKNIENQFACRITDTYGCGEGIQVAAQYPSGNGKYHIFMPHIIVEIVNNENIPVTRGEYGKILLTKLEPGAMPLIRYDVGDVGRMAIKSICECGRGLDSLESIDGRVSDFIYTPNGNRLIVHFFTGIFEYYPEVNEFQITQTVRNKITITIVPSPTFNKSILTRIKHEILGKGDKNLLIEFKIASKIDLPKTGKRKFVISKISDDQR